MSPSTWAVSACPGGRVEKSAARSARAGLRSAAGGRVPGAGLGVAEGVISGKRPDAFPAPMSVLLMRFRFGGAAGVISGKRPVAFPAAMSVLVVPFWFGIGPGGSVETRRDAPAGPAVPLDEARVDGVGDAEWVVLAVAVTVGVADANRVGLTLGVGDPERVGLAVGVGVGEAERVGLALTVGVGVGADVDGEGEGDADFDGDGGADADGLGKLEVLGPMLVLAAAEEGEGDGELDGSS